MRQALIAAAAVLAAVAVVGIAQPKAAQPEAPPDAVAGAAEAEVPLETVEAKASYILGLNIARNMQQQGLEIQAEPLIAGIRDALGGNEVRLSMQEMQATMMAYQQKMQARQAEAAAESSRTGMAFLEENRKKEDIKVTDSGLQYKVIEQGGGESPDPTDIVRVHYRGQLVDGTVFDSSYERGQPATFPVNGVIKGWTEALQLMKVGGKWRLFVPSDLAYGDQGRPPRIPPKSTLIFDVELLGIEEQGE